MPLEGSPLVGDSQTHLVGRTDELTRLRDYADKAVEEGSQMVLLSGDAGIGKSSLVKTFMTQLSSAGWGTHVGHCIEFADRPLPFGPIVSILRSVLLDNLDHLDNVVGHHRDDLSGLLPELRDGRPDGASLAGDVDRLFDAISATLIGASNRRPIVVLVEDIHWADAATRDLLASLVHSLGSSRVLLLVTERTAALPKGHALRTWLAERRRFPNVNSIELEGLTRDDIADQAEDLLGEAAADDLVDELYRRTGGNAYFAHELLVAKSEGGDALPTSLVEFLTSRLEKLTDDERDVLRCVAVAGGTVSHPMLVSMLPHLSVGDMVRALFEYSILVIDGSGYTFRHALLREAILREILPFEAEDLHRQAAEALLADPQRGTTPGDLASLAVHWGKANDPDKSLLAAVAAANASATVAAYRTAAEMALQASRAWPLASMPEELTGMERDELLLQTSEWLASCYRGTEAVELINEALDGWAKELAADRRALLLARMAPIHFHLSNPTEATGLLAEAQRLIGDEVSPEAAQVHHRVAKQAVSDGQIHPALEAAERAIEISRSEGPRIVLVEAMTTKALGLGVTEDLDAGISLAREARQLALEEGFVSQVANTYRTEMLIFTFREGRTDECLDAMRNGLEYAERHCGPRWRDDFRLDLAIGYVEAGQLNNAEPLIDQILLTGLDDFRRLSALQTSGMHAMATGALEAAGAFLADATVIAQRYQSAQETGLQDRLLAELARRKDRLDEALDLVDQALKRQLASDNVTFTRESIVEKIRIVRAIIRRGGLNGVDELDSVSKLVADFDVPGKANLAAKSLMNLELAATDETIDLDRANETIGLLEGAGFGYEAARARLLVIEHLLVGGQSDRPLLETNLLELRAAASEHGMKWIVDEVDALTKAARISLRTDHDSTVIDISNSAAAYPHDLTAREVEVLALVAEGLTNKGIGAELYVSPRTVGTHVSNLLAKLGLSNRLEAAAAYRKLGLDSIDLRDPVEARDGT